LQGGYRKWDSFSCLFDKSQALMCIDTFCWNRMGKSGANIKPSIDIYLLSDCSIMNRVNFFWQCMRMMQGTRGKCWNQHFVVVRFCLLKPIQYCLMRILKMTSYGTNAST